MSITNNNEGIIPIESESDLINIRKTVRDVSNKCGFSIIDITRIVTAASELARNVYHYAGSGNMFWKTIEISSAVGIELTFVDNGPGIENIDKAMEIGFSTSKSLGLGLPGAKKLMGEMDIKSEIGKGTTVTVRKWLRKVYEQPVTAPSISNFSFK
jgi:serine/threonine-protein kinase RsbT